jgi:hypothetical protein
VVGWDSSSSSSSIFIIIFAVNVAIVVAIIIIIIIVIIIITTTIITIIIIIPGSSPTAPIQPLVAFPQRRVDDGVENSDSDERDEEQKHQQSLVQGAELRPHQGRGEMAEPKILWEIVVREHARHVLHLRRTPSV